MDWQVVTAAVEGAVDEAIAVRLAREFDMSLCRVFSTRGKPKLLRSLHGYNRAAARSPWWVMVDLDQDGECPAHYAEAILPNPSQHMKLRVVVRAAEAWLLADRTKFARHLRIREGTIPLDPEALDDPKQVVVELAKGSSSRSIREGLTPRPGAGRKVGPGYAASMIEFAERLWNPRAAAERSESLRRCCDRLPART
jgi:hypothetical protein